jgi:hypothetical protein
MILWFSVLLVLFNKGKEISPLKHQSTKKNYKSTFKIWWFSVLVVLFNKGKEISTLKHQSTKKNYKYYLKDLVV